MRTDESAANNKYNNLGNSLTWFGQAEILLHSKISSRK